MENIFFLIVLAVTTGVAWSRGGLPERAAAVMLATAAIVSGLIAGNAESKFSALEWGLFATDSALFFALLGLALWADRYWPMWLAALQFVSVWMHPAFGLSQHKMAFAYAIATIFWAYPMQMILVVGTLRHHRRKVAAQC
jgi:hypothetical protein